MVQGRSRYGFLLGLAEQLSLVGGLCITANSAVSCYGSISVSGSQRRLILCVPQSFFFFFFFFSGGGGGFWEGIHIASRLT
jgi:hypothetical protein